MSPLRIALYQGPARPPATVADGLAALESAARQAAGRGARLLVTPELSLTGYALGDRVGDLAEPADGDSARALAAVAAESGIALVYGYPERDGDRVYNAVQLLGPDGRTLARYRKTHLYGGYESAHYAPGERLLVQADLDGVRLGLVVCYDVEFPETVRAHALAGTELLLVPTALMTPYEIVPETLVPARAWESQLYLAYANRLGAEGDFHFAGLSRLAAPDGTLPARAGTGEELIVADVDPDVLRASRAENSYLADRRPELYAAP